MFYSLFKFPSRSKLRWILVAVELIFAIPMNGMKREIIGESYPAKRRKLEQVELISTEGLPLAIDISLALQSPTLKAIINQRGIGLSIKVNANIQMLEFIKEILEVLLKFTSISEQGVLYGGQYNLLAQALKPRLDSLPLSETVNLCKISTELRLTSLTVAIFAYLNTCPQDEVKAIWEGKPVDIAKPLPKLLQSLTATTLVNRPGNITLTSIDEKEYTLACKVACISLTVNRLMEDIGVDNAIPLREVKGKELAVIVECLKKIAAINNAEDYGKYLAEALNPFFMGMSYADIIQIYKAVSYLDIKILVDYLTALIATKLQLTTSIDAVANFTALLDDTQNIPTELAGLVRDSLKQLNQQLILRMPAKILKELKGDEQPRALAMSTDGKFALIAGQNKLVRLWNLESGRIIKILRHESAAKAITFSRDGKYALTGCDWALAWNLADDGEELKHYKKFAVESPDGRALFMHSVAISPDGKQVLTGSLDGSVILWDFETGKQAKELKGHTGKITSVAFSPDGKKALTGSFDTTLKLWNLTEEADELKPVKTINFVHTITVNTIQFCPCGEKALVSITTDEFKHMVLLIDLKTSSTIRCLANQIGFASLSVSPCGNFALLALESYGLLWDLETGRVIKDIKIKGGNVKNCMLSSDGKLALVSWLNSAILLQLTEADQLSLPELVLIIKLSQRDDKGEILKHSYFSMIYKKSSKAVKNAIKVLFNI